MFVTSFVLQRLLVAIEASLRCRLFSQNAAASTASGSGGGTWEMSGPERLGVKDRLEACLAALEDDEAGGSGVDVVTDVDGDDPCEVTQYVNTRF